MKTLFTLIALLLLCLTLSACNTTAGNARLGALTELAISYAETRGKISPADAQAIREAKVIILPSEAPSPALPEVEVSGK